MFMYEPTEEDIKLYESWYQFFDELLPMAAKEGEGRAPVLYERLMRLCSSVHKALSM